MDFDLAIDDKPVPVEIPMELGGGAADRRAPLDLPIDLGGSAGDKVELAKTSDFLEFPATSAADAGSFSGDGQSLVESETLATLANPSNPSAPSAPMPLEPIAAEIFDDSGASAGDAVPLASNHDFLGMSELNSTGEQWTKKDTGLSLEEEPTLDGEIIQGEMLEDEAAEVPVVPELELQTEWADAPTAPVRQVASPQFTPAPKTGPAPWPSSSLAIPAPEATSWPAAAVGVKAAAQVRLAPPAAPAPLPPPAPPAAPAPVPASAQARPAPALPAPARPPAAFVPGPPPKVASAVPGPPLRATSSAPYESVAPGRDHSLFGAPGAAFRDESTIIKGEHRVILHTIEGQVKRGAIRDANLGDDAVGLETQPGALEKIPRPRIKAIFFMLPAGEKAPAPKGDKLRVTFRDGRQLAGFSSDHRASGIGFFVVPADNRTNTERIFIYRASVEKVSVD